MTHVFSMWTLALVAWMWSQGQHWQPLQVVEEFVLNLNHIAALASQPPCRTELATRVAHLSLVVHRFASLPQNPSHFAFDSDLEFAVHCPTLVR